MTVRLLCIFILISSSLNSFSQKPKGYVILDSVIQTNDYYRKVYQEIIGQHDSLEVIIDCYVDSMERLFFSWHSGPCFEAQLDSLKLAEEAKSIERTINRFEKSMDNLFQQLNALYVKEHNILFLELYQKLECFGEGRSAKFEIMTGTEEIIKRKDFTTQFLEYLRSDTTHLKPQDYKPLPLSCH